MNSAENFHDRKHKITKGFRVKWPVFLNAFAKSFSFKIAHNDICGFVLFKYIYYIYNRWLIIKISDRSSLRKKCIL